METSGLSVLGRTGTSSRDTNSLRHFWGATSWAPSLARVSRDAGLSTDIPSALLDLGQDLAEMK